MQTYKGVHTVFLRKPLPRSPVHPGRFSLIRGPTQTSATRPNVAANRRGRKHQYMDHDLLDQDLADHEQDRSSLLFEPELPSVRRRATKRDDKTVPFAPAPQIYHFRSEIGGIRRPFATLAMLSLPDGCCLVAVSILSEADPHFSYKLGRIKALGRLESVRQNLDSKDELITPRRLPTNSAIFQIKSFLENPPRSRTELRKIKNQLLDMRS
jgi:hypothetical protein